ncbi:MAG: hypothetical protein CMN04_09755 [Roseibacillus sp.]|nr:hypothetical protein [Roseibacillus sp.]
MSLPPSLPRAVLTLVFLQTAALMAAPPRITEFMASNDGIIADEDGDYPDWIEIHNPDPTAIDLAGHSLTDDPSEPRQWIFPAGSVVRGGGYLVVFASGKNRTPSGAELHTNFELNAGGDYLSLLAPDGSSILTEFGSEVVPFPRQRPDISYGTGEASLKINLLGETPEARYLVPAGENDLGSQWPNLLFDDATWNSGSLALGFDLDGNDGSAIAPRNHWPLDDGFGSIARDTSGNFPGSLIGIQGGSSPWDLDAPPIAGGPESSLRFDGTATFLQTTLPGIGGSSSRSIVFWIRSDDTSNHGIISWGNRDTPSGKFHLRLNSNPDSGTLGAIRCDLGGGSAVGSTSIADNQWHHVAVVFEEDTTPTLSDLRFYIDGIEDLATGPANVPVDTDISSIDSLEVAIGRRVERTPLYFSGNLADVALYEVALTSDAVTRLAQGTFRPSSSIGFGSYITTNVESEMLNQGSSLFVRTRFDLPPDYSLEGLRLFLRYDDGIRAFINGEEVASTNIPEGRLWNARAQTERTNVEAVSTVVFNASQVLPVLRPTNNILALHGANLNAGDRDFLINARLEGIDLGQRSAGYFLTPTPGAENTGEPDTGAFVADTKFAPNRGFYEKPFNLTISSKTEGASIYYTLDGSEPSSSNGILYNGPLAIDGTATVRAVALKLGLVSTNIDTHTYIFPASVLTQSTTPQGFPTAWGERATDYEMDPDLIGTAYSREEIIDSLRSLPSISVVMNVDDLFDGESGFYANSDQRGDEWEKRCSYEFFDFPNGAQTQLNGGIRAVGRASRSANRGKHNLRAVFRSEYGPTKLQFPLFADSEVIEFNSLILRGGNGDSWLNPGVVERAQYIRDQWHRDAQRATGQPFQHQMYAHLYLNGLYWGMYHIFERFEDDMLAEHFGGEEEDWDAIKDAGRASVLEVVDGDLSAWNRTLAVTRRDMSNPRNYANALIFIDPDTWIDYFITNFYSGNTDWDQSNWRAARRRDRDAKWMLFAWDSERTDLNATQGTNSSTNDATVENTPNFPSSVHQRLTANEEYRLRFADRVRLHCFNGGTFTPEGAAQLWDARADEIYEPLIVEAIRWGDRHRFPPARRETFWRQMYNTMQSDFFPQRTETLISQLRARGLYPSVEAPDFTPHGGLFTDQSEVTISASTGGTIYYTTDGSDPRRPTTAGSESLLLPEGSSALAFVPTDDSLAMTWTEPEFDAAGWIGGASGVGFELDTGFEGLFGVDLSEMHSLNSSAYARWEFEIHDRAQLAAITSLTLRARYDDGFIAYLNGGEAASANRPANPAWNSHASAAHPDGSAVEFSIFNLSNSINRLRLGTNVLAVHCMNQQSDSNDLLFIPELVAATGTIPAGVSPSAQVYNGPSLALGESTRLQARALRNGTWSALTTAIYTIGTPATSEHIAISEVHYHPLEDTPTEFLELINISDEVVDLTGLSFANGIAFTFPEATLLSPGERTLVVENITAFEIAYGLGLPIAGSFANGTRLSNGGERITLLARDGSIISDFRYRDSHPWPQAPDQTGQSLILVAPGESSPSNPLSWRASILPGGNPSSSDSISFLSEESQSLLGYALTDSSELQFSVVNGLSALSFLTRSAADDATIWVEFSPDLRTWTDAPAEALVSRDTRPDGTTLFRFTMPDLQQDLVRFARLRVELR